MSLKNKKAIESFEIEADAKMINGQIENIQSQYGKLVSKTVVEDGFELNVNFVNTEFNIDNTSTFQLKNIKGKSNKDSIKNMKIGDVITLKTKRIIYRRF